MSKPDTWMPLYIGDYLQDTTRLSTEQHGAYLLLIMDYWTNGPLPDDDTSLAQITRMQPTAWKKSRAAIARLFQIADGEWRHKRIDEELEKATQFLAKQKANGAKGGRPKKTQTKPMGFSGLQKTGVIEEPKHNPNESPSPSPLPVNPLTEKSSVVDQPSSRPDAPPENATRVGSLCKHLRIIGIDAAPHLPVWPDLLGRFTDEEIVAVAEIAKERKPGERIHLNYLVTMLNEPPKAPPAQAKRRAPQLEAFARRDYGTGGRL